MKGLIGKKLGMTQIFSADGEAVPVTVLEVAPSTVLQVKTRETDGYEAIQVGYGAKKKLHRQSKANRARAERAGLESAPQRIREFRTPDADRFTIGDQITADFFEIGDRVKIRGTSKGRGFAGGMKRHGFGGGTRQSHGGGPSHRGVGSVGMSATPARTTKGRKLPGQYGNKKVTEHNLVVVDVNAEEQILIVRGSVPGPVNGLVRIELIGAEPRDYTPQVSHDVSNEAATADGSAADETAIDETAAAEETVDAGGQEPGDEDSALEPEGEATAGETAEAPEEEADSGQESAAAPEEDAEAGTEQESAEAEAEEKSE